MSNIAVRSTSSSKGTETSVKEIMNDAWLITQKDDAAFITAICIDGEDDMSNRYIQQMFEMIDRLQEENFDWKEPKLIESTKGKYVYASVEYLSKCANHIKRFAQMSYTPGKTVLISYVCFGRRYF